MRGEGGREGGHLAAFHVINFTDIRDGVSRSVNPHLGASAKAINNATRKIYDGNFICNFRAVKDYH